jgi:hypothetical protein
MSDVTWCGAGVGIAVTFHVGRSHTNRVRRADRWNEGPFIGSTQAGTVWEIEYGRELPKGLIVALSDERIFKLPRNAFEDIAPSVMFVLPGSLNASYLCSICPPCERCWRVLARNFFCAAHCPGYTYCHKTGATEWKDRLTIRN